MFSLYKYFVRYVVWFSLVTQSCLTLCNPMNHSMPGLPVHHHSRSSPKLIPIELVMPSNHLILYCPLILLPSIFSSMRVFSMSQFFASGGQSVGVPASASVLPMNIWTDFLQDRLVGSPCSPRDSSFLQHCSSKASILQHSAFIIV